MLPSSNKLGYLSRYWEVFFKLLTLTLLASLVITRRHIFAHLPILGNFNEWTVLDIHVFDVILLLTFFSVLAYLIYCHYPTKENTGSSYSQIIKTCLLSIKQSVLKNYKTLCLLLAIWILLVGVALNHNNSFEAKMLSLYYFWQFLKLYLFILLLSYLKKIYFGKPRNQTTQKLLETKTLNASWRARLSRISIQKIILRSLFFLSTFESGVAILQFALQKNIGLGFLGEEILSPLLLNVAKVDVGSLKFLRPYGTFSHPNILGFFIVLGLFSCAIHYASQVTSRETTKELKTNKKQTYKSIVLLSALSLNLVALVFSFSRSAWLLLLVAVLIFISILYFKYKNCLTDSGRSQARLLFSKLSSNIWLCFMIVLPVIVVTTFLTKDLIMARSLQPNINETQNINFRASTLSPLSSFKLNLLTGYKENNFALEVQKNSLDKPLNEGLEQWEIQPPHNIYLYILYNWGLVGLFLFSLFVLFHIHKLHPVKGMAKITTLKTTLDLKVDSSSALANSLEYSLKLGFVLGILFVSFNLDHFLISLPEGIAIFGITIIITNRE